MPHNTRWLEVQSGGGSGAWSRRGHGIKIKNQKWKRDRERGCRMGAASLEIRRVKQSHGVQDEIRTVRDNPSTATAKKGPSSPARATPVTTFTLTARNLRIFSPLPRDFCCLLTAKPESLARDICQQVKSLEGFVVSDCRPYYQPS